MPSRAWIGGSTRAHRAWRQAVLERDGHLCVTCRARGIYTAATCVDHVQPLAQRPDLALDIENGQSLCNPCHQRKHGGRPRYGADSSGWPRDPRHAWNQGLRK